MIHEWEARSPWQLDVGTENTPFTEVHQEFDPGQSPAIIAEEPSSAPPPLHRIIEALLFASEEVLSEDQFAPYIRGLTPAILEETITALNHEYQQRSKPYVISRAPTGYRLVLRNKYRACLEHLYGGMKEIRLTPQAIEVLSIIAYRQPIALAEIEAIQGNECRNVLRLLIRRGLVQAQENKEGELEYCVTSRFLELFRLNRVEDLPRADDLERL